MSKTKLALALVIAHALTPAIAQNTTPLTIQEWTNRQAEIRRAEMDAKLSDARHKGSGAAGVAATAVTAPLARSCNDDLAMVGVYGGRRLYADFSFRGAIIPAAPGDQADMGGWSVEELTPTRAIMVKRDAKGKGTTRCRLYLSNGVRDIASPAAPAAATQVDTSVQVPPISPAAASGAPSLGSAK